MTYCTQCGAPRQQGADFCGNCGASAGQAVASAPPSGAAPLMTVLPQPSTSRSKKGTGIWLAVILAAACVIVAGVVYFGYVVKQKAHAAFSQMKNEAGDPAGKAGSDEGNKSQSEGGEDASDDKNNPLSAVLSKLQSGDSTTPMGNMAKSVLGDLGAKNPEVPSDLVRNIPYSAIANPLPCPEGGQLNLARLASGSIHFKPETDLTYSWSLPQADAEGDNVIRSIAPATLVFEHIGIAAQGLDMSIKAHADFANTVCAKDITQGETYSTGWTFVSTKEPITPGLYPGVSRLLLPATKFAELKSSGSTTLVFAWYDYMDALTEWEMISWKGVLKRVEPDDVPFPLIINDERVNVPAIHVRANMLVLENGGKFGPRDQPADAYILDDPNTPVMLSWMMGVDLHQDDSFRVQLIRVTYPSEKPSIEQQLQKNRKAITWGINFEFNSDAIRPVSEPVLKEIAQAMANRPDWKLTVTGHTDNIGGHSYNLDLSQRRAAAVKKALVDRYHVDPSRLSTGGDGDSAPIDTNDTLEGRARNRRVELTLD